MTTLTFGKILGLLILSGLLILFVPTAMAEDQQQTRERGEIPQHDQDPDQIRDQIRGGTTDKLLDGDRLRTRDRLRDGSCQVESLSSEQNNNRHEWRYQNRNMLNGDVPPGSQGFALLPLWLVWF
jgi:hypothetical protein